MKNLLGKLLTTAAALAAISLMSAGIPAHAQETRLVLANSQWLDALRGEKLWNAMLKYNEVAPDVTLEQEAIPSHQFYDKITTQLGAGQGADIVIMQDALFYAIADAGLLVPLNDVVEGAENLNNTNDGGMVDGVQLGIAWHRAPYALIYNKPLLEELGVDVPSNVDELIASAKMAADRGLVGFIARHQMNEVALWYKDFENWLYGYGANLVDDSGKLTVNTPEAVAAVAAFKKVYDAGIIPIGDDMTTQRSRFKEKQAALGIENSGSSLNIASGGALANTELGAAPLPFEHPGAHQQIFITINKHSDNQEAAKDFLRWLIIPQGQQALRDASGPDTLATDVPVTDEFKVANPWSVTFAEVAADSRSGLIPGYEVETQEIMRMVMEAVERVIVADADPAAALAEAQTRIDARF